MAKTFCTVVWWGKNNLFWWGMVKIRWNVRGSVSFTCVRYSSLFLCNIVQIFTYRQIRPQTSLQNWLYSCCVLQHPFQWSAHSLGAWTGRRRHHSRDLPLPSSEFYMNICVFYKFYYIIYWAIPWLVYVRHQIFSCFAYLLVHRKNAVRLHLLNALQCTWNFF